MQNTLYVASSNPGKLRDFAVAAATHNIAVLPVPGLDSIAAPPEDEPDFAGNARAKAEYYSHYVAGEMVLSDDSGLEVDYLHGAPGVRSARYAADAGFTAVPQPDANNNLLLLHQLTGVPIGRRKARYRCALAVARDGVTLYTTEGTAEGEILTAPRGTRGFGYDPLFQVAGLGKTMAEIDDDQRWAVSHRGVAFRALLNYFPQ